jgi:hypothetical protein
MMPTAEVVGRIGASPAPVLLGDSCALLDIIRDPMREAFSAGHARVTMRLVERAEAKPPTLWLPLASQVLIEINENRPRIHLGAETSLKKLDATFERVRLLMLAFGVTTTGMTRPGLVESGFLELTNGVFKRYLDAGLELEQPAEVANRAFARIAANLAPSDKGQQAKDCAIIETYLHLTRQLRENNINVPVVFLTTNKNDYSAPDDSASIHPDLKADFEAAELRYAANFQMAEHLLK